MPFFSLLSISTAVNGGQAVCFLYFGENRLAFTHWYGDPAGIASLHLTQLPSAFCASSTSWTRAI